jgi:hypothetical protein
MELKKRGKLQLGILKRKQADYLSFMGALFYVFPPVKLRAPEQNPIE